VTVLLSGGLDSTACLSFYRGTASPVDTIFVDYGHPAAPFEHQAAQAVAHAYGVSLVTIRCSGLSVAPTADVAGRNGLLFFAALAHGGFRPRLIAAGIHAGTPYYDCSPEFLEGVDAIVRTHTRGCVRIAAPFLSWSKSTIWDFCRTHSVPVNLTRSCDSDAAEPCGHCISCLDRAQLL
jgi:7-cyano-7-deazaguanine synthase